MASPINSDVPSQTLKLQSLDKNYSLTVKQRKFDDVFDEITIKPSRNEMKALRSVTRYAVSTKELIVKKMKKQIKRKTLKIRDLKAKVNAITGGRPNVSIENYMDFDFPFINFRYVNDCIISNDIKLSSEDPTGCGCGSSDGTMCCYKSRSRCCASEFNSTFAYDREGRLTIPQGNAIYECCSNCNCSPNCGNRIVQQGSNGHELCVYKTPDSRGWGVKTLKAIPKGTFVDNVVGEIVTKSEAARREKIQFGLLQQTYLFDLDFVGPKRHQFSIDCFAYGNITRYLNHCCDPNLAVYNVWIDHRDHTLPKLALFALRDIQKDEELTLDYKPQLGNRRKKQSQTIRANQIPCLCGAENCRRFLWTS